MDSATRLRLVPLLSGTVLVLASAAGLAAPPETVVPRAPQRIVVDGSLSEWTASKPLELRSGALDPRPGASTAWSGVADCAASLMLCWDDVGLYVAGTVDDDRQVVQPGSLYLGDSVEVFLRIPEAGGPRDYQLILSPLAEQTRWEFAVLRGRRGLTDGGFEGVQVAGRRLEDGKGAYRGYAFEAALPLSNFPGFDPAAGGAGINLAVVDADEGPGQESYLLWSGKTLPSYDPSAVAPLRFEGAGAAPARPAEAGGDIGVAEWKVPAAILAGTLAALALLYAFRRPLRRLGGIPLRRRIAYALVLAALVAGVRLAPGLVEARRNARARSRLAGAVDAVLRLAAEAEEARLTAPGRTADAGSPLVDLVAGRALSPLPEYRWLPLPAVPAAPRRTLGSGTPVRATAVPLDGAGRARFRLAEPVEAESLCVVLSWRDPAEGRTGPPPGTVVGRLTALASDGSADVLDIRLGRDVDDERAIQGEVHRAAESKVAWMLENSGHADEISWRLPAARRVRSLEAEQVVSEGALSLRGVTLLPPGGAAPVLLPLGRTTGEGAPTGSWNGAPAEECLVLGPGATKGRIPIDAAADAFVVVYGCPGGPPASAAGNPAASLRLVYEDGRDSAPVPLVAGIHLDAEALAGAAHPAGFLANLAYRWPGPDGEPLHRDSVTLPSAAPDAKVAAIEVLLLAPDMRLVVDSVIAARRAARTPPPGLSLLARDGDSWSRSAAATAALEGVVVTHYRGGRAVATTLPAELRERVLGTEVPPEIRPGGLAGAPGGTYVRTVGGRTFLARQARLPSRDSDDVLEAAIAAPDVADLAAPVRWASLLLLALLVPLALSAAVDLLGFLPRLHGKLVGAFAVAAVLPLVGFTLLLARHFEAGVDRGLEGELRSHADAAARAVASRREEARRLAAEMVRDEALLAAVGAADDAAGAGRVDAELRELSRRAGSGARVSLEVLRAEGPEPRRRTYPSRETPAPFQGLYEPADGLDFRWSRLWATGVAAGRAGSARLRLVVEVPVDDRSLEDVRRAGGDRAHVLLFSPAGYPAAGTADLDGERSSVAAAERRAVADDLRRAPGEPEIRARTLGGLPHAVAWDLVRASDGRTVGILATAVPRPPLLAAALGTRDLVLLLGSLALLVAVVVANLVARRVADPVAELARAAGRLGQGDFGARASESGRDEIASLGAAFNGMAGLLEGRIGELSRLQETMAGFAAHLDRERLLAKTLEAFRESAGPGGVLVALLDGERGDIEVAAGFRGDAALEPRRLSAAGFLGPALRDPSAREVAIPADAPADERALLGGASRVVVLPFSAGADRAAGAVLLPRGGDAGETPERAGSLAFLAALARQAGIALENARLYRLALEDPSTGLHAGSYVRRRLGEEVDRSAETGRPVSLLFLAAEGVGAVFESRGPEEGNALLRAVADRMRGGLRGMHVLGRSGRDVLVVVLPETPRAAAEGIAASLRAAVEGAPFSAGPGGRETRVGISAAVATAPDDARSAEFLENEAVRALAKARGERGAAKPGAGRAPALPGVDPAEAEALGFRSAKSLLLLDALNRIAAGDVPVLVLGETGVGKEVVADVVHAKSRRSAGPLVKVNCAALPGPLLEAELFGHEKGAFTGADRRRAGRFEQANGGTLFLDEIGELPPPLQVKLLRVLQDGKVERLGGTGPVEADVRVVAATNRDLPAMIEAGTFREDLYYRLNVLSVVVPPLRARREDIPPLADRFLADARAKHGSGPASFSPEALDFLFRHPFPGNVRQLRNMVERAVVAARGPAVTPADLSFGEEAAGGTVPLRKLPAIAAARNDGGGTVPGVPSLNSPLSPRAAKLLDAVRARGTLTNRQWCEESGVSDRTGLRDFEELMAAGLVVRSGKRRSASYAAAR